jgi:hypothetical protein
MIYCDLDKPPLFAVVIDSICLMNNPFLGNLHILMNNPFLGDLHIFERCAKNKIFVIVTITNMSELDSCIHYNYWKGKRKYNTQEIDTKTYNCRKTRNLITKLRWDHFLKVQHKEERKSVYDSIFFREWETLEDKKGSTFENKDINHIDCIVYHQESHPKVKVWLITDDKMFRLISNAIYQLNCCTYQDFIRALFHSNLKKFQ